MSKSAMKCDKAFVKKAVQTTIYLRKEGGEQITMHLNKKKGVQITMHLIKIHFDNLKNSLSVILYNTK